MSRQRNRKLPRRPVVPEPVVVEREPCCCGVKGCTGAGLWPANSPVRLAP